MDALEGMMKTGSKILLGTTLGLAAVAYSWMFRSQKAKSSRHELGDRPGEPRHW